MFARNAFGSQRMSCISGSRSTFWYWDYTQRGGVSKNCDSVSLGSAIAGRGDAVSDWSPAAGCAVTQPQPHFTCRRLTALRGQSLAQEWQGSGVKGRGGGGGHKEAGTYIGTWKDQRQYLSRALHFLKQERGYIFLHFFSSFSFSFWRFWSCL